MNRRVNKPSAAQLSRTNSGLAKSSTSKSGAVKKAPNKTAPNKKSANKSQPAWFSWPALHDAGKDIIYKRFVQK